MRKTVSIGGEDAAILLRAINDARTKCPVLRTASNEEVISILMGHALAMGKAVSE